MNMRRICRTLLLCYLLHIVGINGISRITDHDLAHAVAENDYVLVFLLPGGCDSPECMYAQSELNRVIEAGTIPGLQIFQAYQSDIAKRLSSNSEPLVIFYRKSVPILYNDGMILRDEILTWMENNKEKHSISLNSENFEHLTQASTGATTGDWLVLFHKKSGCEDLMPVWEAVATRLRHKLNVAEVDMGTSSELRTRFQIQNCPSVFFFRHGKMYSYELTVRDVQSFVSFADGWYTNAPSRPVPVEPSPFDVFTDKIVSWLKDTIELVSNVFSFWGIISLTIVALVAVGAVRHIRLRHRKQKLF